MLVPTTRAGTPQVLADFNADGKPDLLWFNKSTDEAYVWFMDGATRTGGVSLGSVPDPDWRLVGVGDFNADNNPDLLWHNKSTGEVYIWLMTGTTRVAGASVGTLPDFNWRLA